MRDALASRPAPTCRRRLGPRLGLGLLVALACGCGKPALSGSLSDLYSLAFDHTVLLTDGSAVVIEYRAGTDIVLKAVVDGGDSLGAGGGTLTGSAFLSRVTLSRITAKNEPLPATVQGSITFDAYGVAPGTQVSGHFDALFADGHTVLGNFSGRIAAGS